MSALLRICIVNPYCYSLFKDGATESAGGAELQLKTLGMALHEQGHDVHFVVDDFGQDEVVVESGVTLHKAPLRYMGGSNLYLLPDWLNFIRQLWRIDADVHMIKVPRNLLLPLSVFSRLRFRKVIYIGQRDVDTSSEGVLATDSRLAYWFYRWGLFLSDAVVAQTDYQKELFRKNFRKESTVIRNVVTLQESRSVEKEDFILWVGNSSYRKQPELVPELARRLPHYRFKMIMSLMGERSSDDFIRNEASQLQNLEYIGYVPFREIGSYYNGAKLLVSTSLSEGFPNTFLQSWQSGTPVASLHVDPDGVIDRFGLGCISGSMDSLANQIEQLMQDDIRLHEMSNKARAYVEEYHSIKKSIDAYEELFTRLSNQ